MRTDALWATDACRKRAQRTASPAKARTRKPTLYRVFEIDMATGRLTPANEISAHDRESAIAQSANGASEYVAIPVRSLRLYDAAGRKV